MATEVQERTTVGAVIREYRIARNISARQLSLSAGLSDSYVGKLESGAIECSLSAFAKIAVALKMKQAEVFVLVCNEAMR